MGDYAASLWGEHMRQVFQEGRAGEDFVEFLKKKRGREQGHASYWPDWQRGRPGKPAPWGRGYSPDPKDGQRGGGDKCCFRCGAPGHFAADCRRKPRDITLDDFVQTPPAAVRIKGKGKAEGAAKQEPAVAWRCGTCNTPHHDAKRTVCRSCLSERTERAPAPSEARNPTDLPVSAELIDCDLEGEPLPQTTEKGHPDTLSPEGATKLISILKDLGLRDPEDILSKSGLVLPTKVKAPTPAGQLRGDVALLKTCADKRLHLIKEIEEYNTRLKGLQEKLDCAKAALAEVQHKYDEMHVLCALDERRGEEEPDEATATETSISRLDEMAKILDNGDHLGKKYEEYAAQMRDQGKEPDHPAIWISAAAKVELVKVRDLMLAATKLVRDRGAALKRRRLGAGSQAT